MSVVIPNVYARAARCLRREARALPMNVPSLPCESNFLWNIKSMKWKSARPCLPTPSRPIPPAHAWPLLLWSISRMLFVALRSRMRRDRLAAVRSSLQEWNLIRSRNDARAASDNGGGVCAGASRSTGSYRFPPASVWLTRLLASVL